MADASLTSSSSPSSTAPRLLWIGSRAWSWLVAYVAVKQVELVIPLQLMGGTMDVYQQLSDNVKVDVGLIKAALYKAFVMEPCTTYKHFPSWILMAGDARLYHQVTVSQKEVTAASRGLLLGSSAPLWRQRTETMLCQRTVCSW